MSQPQRPGRTRGRLATVSILVVSGVLLAGCVQATSEEHLKPIDESELTQQSDLVVEGKLLSEEVMALAEDPALPHDWENDAELNDLVKSGAQRRKWRFAVENWRKGSSDSRIVASRPVAKKGAGIGVWSEAESESQLTLPSWETGKRYLVWLQPDPYLPGNYFLIHARKLG